MGIYGIRKAIGICLLLFGASLSAETLNLEQMRSIVLDQNTDVKTQYEKYYQAQRNVSVKYGEFLPNLDFYVLYAPTTAAILQSVIPTPSDWFVYQASKELQIAERYTGQTLRLNMLEGLTNTYVNILGQKKILRSLKEQRLLYVENYEDARANEELGFGNPTRTFQTKRRLLEHDQQIFLLESLIAAQKESLLIALNMTPNGELNLEELDEDELLLPETPYEAAQLALSRSTELVSNRFMQEAARYMVKSQRYSFISFEGIGFDYPALVSIERSKLAVLQLQAEQLRVKIENQVYAAYKELELLEKRIELQEENLWYAQKILAGQKELYEGRQISKEVLDESKVEVKVEQRTLLTLNTERQVLKNKIKRLIGLEATSRELQTDTQEQYELLAQVDGMTLNLTVNSTGELGAQIVNVVYTVEGFKRPSYRTNEQTNYLSSYQYRYSGTYKVKAEILLQNGLSVVKETVVEL
ncbi:MAG: TolC family protein [Bacteriovoracaceae bacterium]|nr:TolC family protein [Bacteriovoracaceae bacterium]